MVRAPRARRAVLLLTLLASALVAGQARAQEATASRREVRVDTPLSLADAVGASQRAAPDVLVSIARSATARSEIGVAGIFTSPQVTVGTSTGSAVLVTSLFIALPVFGQRGTAIDAAEAQAAASRAGLEVTRVDARLAVSVAWTAVWLAQHEAEVAAETADRRERLLEIARVRLEEGAGSRLDVLRAEIEARRARADATARRDDQGAARARLCPLIGLDPMASRFEVAGEPTSIGALPAIAALESLVATHPVTRQARASLHAADAGVIRDRRSRWPLVGVQLGAGFANRSPPPTNDYNAALTVGVPLFNAALVTRAQSLRGEAGSVLVSTTSTLRGRVMAARSDYLAADRRYRAAAEQVLPTAREAAELASEGYRSGGLDLTATLAVEQALTDARLAAVRAHADRGRAAAAIEHGAGRSL